MASSEELGDDPATTRVRFNLRQAFPPDDPVGHFVLVLAAAMTDLMLVNALLFPPDNPERDDFTTAERSILTRMLLAMVWEVHVFVEEAVKASEVNEFLTDLGREYPPDRRFSGEELVAFLRGEVGLLRSELRKVLVVARNSTFHYPRPGDKGLRQVLGEFDPDTEGELTYGAKMPSVQASFAEEVLMNFAYRAMDEKDEGTLGALFSGLAEIVVAVVHLAQLALDLRLASVATSVEND